MASYDASYRIGTTDGINLLKSVHYAPLLIALVNEGKLHSVKSAAWHLHMPFAAVSECRIPKRRG